MRTNLRQFSEIGLRMWFFDFSIFFGERSAFLATWMCASAGIEAH